MMKRTILSVLSLVLVVGFAAAQEQVENKDVKGIHPTNVSKNDTIADRLAHFSLGIEAGFNAFDGDFNSEMKHPVWAPMAGLSFEYHLTPVWTIGAQYSFDWYRVTGKDGQAAALLDGRMHRIHGTVGFDLMATCFPRWKRRIFGWDFFVGGGYGWYKNGTYYSDELRHITASVDAKSMEKFRGSAFLLAGTEFSFNINRTLAIGIKGTYSYFMSDEIDGRLVPEIKNPSTDMLKVSVASKNNDGIFDVSVHLRIKLAGVKKTHVRNGSIDEMPYNRKKPEAHLKDTLEIHHMDSLVVCHKDTVMMQDPMTTAALQSLLENEEYYYIYFDNDKYSFTNDALIRIQQVASRLQMDTTLCAEIIGMCDNTGSVDHNDELGWNRAHHVCDELVGEHMIDPDRLAYYGKGIVYGGRSRGSYQPYRRCDVRLIPCDQFEEVKKADEEKKQQLNAVPAAKKDVKDETAPVVKAEKKQAVAPAEQKVTANEQAAEEKVIVVEEGMTLSSIAIAQYKNAYCWVYIYDANKDRLSSPHYLPAGASLVIPALTAEQLDVNKENSEAFLQTIAK